MTNDLSSKKINPHAKWLREVAARLDLYPAYRHTCELAADELENIESHRDNLVTEIERLRAALVTVKNLANEGRGQPYWHSAQYDTILFNIAKAADDASSSSETGVKP